MNINDVINTMNYKIGGLVSALPLVPADAIGLDARCGKVWIDEHNGYIIVGSNRNDFIKFGGLDGIDEKFLVCAGNYVLIDNYSSDFVDLSKLNVK